MGTKISALPNRATVQDTDLLVVADSDEGTNYKTSVSEFISGKGIITTDTIDDYNIVTLDDYNIVTSTTNPLTGEVIDLSGGLVSRPSSVTASVAGGATVITDAIVPIYLHTHSGPTTNNHVWNLDSLDRVTLKDGSGNELAYWISAMGEYDLVPSANLKPHTIADYRGVLWGSDGEGTGALGTFYRSDDNANTWRIITVSLNMSDADGLLWVCSHSGNRASNGEPYLFVLESSGSISRLIRSIDGGLTWGTVKDLFNADFGHGAGAATRSILPMGFCEDITNGVLYMAPYQTSPNEAAIFKSIDHGANWTEIFNSRSTVVAGHFPDVTTQHVHGIYVAAAGNIIYAGTDATINCRTMKSTDSGATWTVITGAAAPQWDLARPVEFGGARYFGTGDGAPNTTGVALYKTTDDASFTTAIAGASPCNNVTADSESLWAYGLSYGKWRYPAIYRTIDGVNFKQVWIGEQDKETIAQFDGYVFSRNSATPAEQPRQTLVGKGSGSLSYDPIRILSGQKRSMALAWVKIPSLPTTGLNIHVERSVPTLAKALAFDLFSDKLTSLSDGLVSRYLLTDNVADLGAVIDSVGGNNGVFDTYNGGFPSTWDSTDGAPTFIFYPPVARRTPCLYVKEGAEDSGGVRFGDVAAFNSLTADPLVDVDGFALCAWVKIPVSVTAANPSIIIGKGYGTTSNMFALCLSSGIGLLSFSVGSTLAAISASSNSSVGSLRDGLWHHVGVNVISSDLGSTSFQFAFDGVLLNQGSPQTLAAEIPNPHTATKNLGIGAAWNSTTPQGALQGKIQDARIYSRTLTPEEWKLIFELRPGIS